MDTNQWWQTRFHAYLNVFLGYMRLIGNSGFLFAVFFLILFGGYYYSLLIQQIPEAFPVALFIALVMTFFIVRCPIRTFLKRPDLVFIIAREEQMKAYFTKAMSYNIVLQSFMILVLAIVLAPLYAAQRETTSYPYFAVILLFLAVKVWNIIVHWYLLRFQYERDKFNYTLLRITASFIFIFLALEGASIFFLVIVAVIMMLFLLYISHTTTKQYGLKWERLIDMEETLLARFYRIVNNFTDVPNLQQRIKARKWLNFLLSFIPFKQKSTHIYLYTRAFFRAGDLLGIYTRLLVIGAIVLALLPYEVGRMLGFFLFLYLSAVQLQPLFHHFSDQELVKLYPLSPSEARKAFRRLCIVLLAIKSVVYAAALSAGGISLGYVAALSIVGVLLSIAYVGMAVKKQGKGIQT